MEIIFTGKQRLNMHFDDQILVLKCKIIDYYRGDFKNARARQCRKDLIGCSCFSRSSAENSCECDSKFIFYMPL